MRYLILIGICILASAQSLGQKPPQPFIKRCEEILVAASFFSISCLQVYGIYCPALAEEVVKAQLRIRGVKYRPTIYKGTKGYLFAPNAEYKNKLNSTAADLFPWGIRIGWIPRTLRVKKKRILALYSHREQFISVSLNDLTGGHSGILLHEEGHAFLDLGLKHGKNTGAYQGWLSWNGNKESLGELWTWSLSLSEWSTIIGKLRQAPRFLLSMVLPAIRTDAKSMQQYLDFFESHLPSKDKILTTEPRIVAISHKEGRLRIQNPALSQFEMNYSIDGQSIKWSLPVRRSLLSESRQFLSDRIDVLNEVIQGLKERIRQVEKLTIEVKSSRFSIDTLKQLNQALLGVREFAEGFYWHESDLKEGDVIGYFPKRKSIGLPERSIYAGN